MRPSLLTPLLVDMMIEALSGGLSRAETAAAVGISERTLYHWLAEGKRLYLTEWTGEVMREEMTRIEQEKLRLFESLYTSPETEPHQEIRRIQSLVEDKRIEKENTENARDERKEERKRREKARNAERAEARKEARFIKKHLKDSSRKNAYIDSVLDFIETEYNDPWR